MAPPKTLTFTFNKETFTGRIVGACGGVIMVSAEVMSKATERVERQRFAVPIDNAVDKDAWRQIFAAIGPKVYDEDGDEISF